MGHLRCKIYIFVILSKCSISENISGFGNIKLYYIKDKTSTKSYRGAKPSRERHGTRCFHILFITSIKPTLLSPNRQIFPAP